MQYAVFPHDFRKFPQNVLNCLEKYQNSKASIDVLIYQNYMISFAFDKDFDWLYFDILDPYERFLVYRVF